MQEEDPSQDTPRPPQNGFQSAFYGPNESAIISDTESEDDIDRKYINRQKSSYTSYSASSPTSSIYPASYQSQISYMPPRPPAISGYPQTAKAMASSPSLQVYRCFSTLNHRVLLQLQDEISELSSMLDSLDLQLAPYGNVRCALADQRTQLLNTVQWKLGQYSTFQPLLAAL